MPVTAGGVALPPILERKGAKLPLKEYKAGIQALQPINLFNWETVSYGPRLVPLRIMNTPKKIYYRPKKETVFKLSPSKTVGNRTAYKTKLVRVECLVCGRVLNKWMKHAQGMRALTCNKVCRKKYRKDTKKKKVVIQRKPRIVRTDFYFSDEWRRVRYEILKERGRKCECCGATPVDGRQVHVDHIKPKSKFPELALSKDNLQILCADCNLGKMAWDQTDWRKENLLSNQ